MKKILLGAVLTAVVGSNLFANAYEYAYATYKNISDLQAEKNVDLFLNLFYKGNYLLKIQEADDKYKPVFISKSDDFTGVVLVKFNFNQDASAESVNLESYKKFCNVLENKIKQEKIDIKSSCSEDVLNTGVSPASIEYFNKVYFKTNEIVKNYNYAEMLPSVTHSSSLKIAKEHHYFHESYSSNQNSYETAVVVIFNSNFVK